MRIVAVLEHRLEGCFDGTSVLVVDAVIELHLCLTALLLVLFRVVRVIRGYLL
jgi:hypothetical protein